MNLLWRAIVMGFGMAAGAALYKRVAEDLGLDKRKKEEAGADAAPVPPPPGDLGGQRAAS
jgi:hypothetical protein